MGFVGCWGASHPEVVLLRHGKSQKMCADLASLSLMTSFCALGQDKSLSQPSQDLSQMFISRLHLLIFKQSEQS